MGVGALYGMKATTKDAWPEKLRVKTNILSMNNGRQHHYDQHPYNNSRKYYPAH